MCNLKFKSNLTTLMLCLVSASVCSASMIQDEDRLLVIHELSGEKNASFGYTAMSEFPSFEDGENCIEVYPSSVFVEQDMDVEFQANPDYKVNVSVDRKAVKEEGSLNFVVSVVETKGADASSEVEFRISKNTGLLVDYDILLTTLNGIKLNNEDWKFDDSSPGLFKLTYIGNNGVFPAGAVSSVGIKAIFKPLPHTSGRLFLNATLKHLAGGDENNSNNMGSSEIQFNTVQIRKQ